MKFDGIQRLVLGGSSVAVICVLAIAASGQVSRKKPGVPKPTVAVEQIKASPAFAEILLKKTEIEAELESLVTEYSEDYPKVKELRFAFDRTKAEVDKLLALSSGDVPKATLALGKLIVQRIDAETDLWRLQQSYADGHPDVKRAKRRVEIYTKAIGEILE